MVGAALLILQRRCRGRGGQTNITNAIKLASKSALRWRSHRVCGRKLRLAGGKKEEQPP